MEKSRAAGPAESGIFYTLFTRLSQFRGPRVVCCGEAGNPQKIPMKKLLSILAFLPLTAFSQASAGAAGVSAQMGGDGDRIVVEARGVKPKVPLFFSAEAESVVHVDAAEARGETGLRLRVVQGRPEVLTLGLAGDGDVVEVKGGGLRDWAVRQAGGRRFLDLRPALPDGQPAPGEWNLTILTKIRKPSGAISVPMLAPGDAVGFSSRVTLEPGDGVDLKVTRADGLLPVDEGAPGRIRKFLTTGEPRLDLALLPRGAAAADAEIFGARLAGRLDAEAGCMRFELDGEARVRAPGARVALLSGGAALDGAAHGDAWHAELQGGRTDVVFDRAGTFPIRISFSARLNKPDDWKGVDFRMPAGTVVPLRLEGLPRGAAFHPAGPLVPDARTMTGFVPADGRVHFGWRESNAAGEGTLFFTSHEQSDVKVGAGLLRQTAQIDFRVLQGRLPGVKIRLDGPGEILGVEGANILGWKVVAEGDHRVLDVRLSRPVEKAGSLVVRSQLALGSFPVRAHALRLTPQGGVRHSGFLRIVNDGAVRLDVSDTAGLMQLSPSQFPGAPADARQALVYRFPAASYSLLIGASQILPEVGVSQVLVYELGDTDRTIKADLELDIREAPLREWSLRVPADYAVVSVKGSAVADYAAESESKGGSRALKILFNGPVDGRQLVHLQLEKNQPAAAGAWALPPLAFPGAKSVRGHVGVVAVSGFRVVPGDSKNLAEMPLSYFPAQLAGLQQAWRVREPAWSAAVKVEALGQSIQADVFHLYSVKEGVVAGSVLINYFVIGAPASEWRVEVPKSVENIDVIGQNVRRDWRRDGDQIVVSLHQPVLGPGTLLVTFEQPMSARGGVIHPGEVRPLGVQSERGFVQVVSPLQVKSNVRKAEGGLLKLEPLELPAEFRLLTSSQSLAVYQYTARPFALDMGIEWYAPAELAEQLVDFARLSSHVSRDGQVVTDVRYFVKTRGRKALRLELPEGVRLWEAKADKETVSAQVDGGQTIVPLPPRLNPNEPVEVLLRLGQASAGARSVRFASPKALSPTVIGEWTIDADAGQLLVPRGGTAALKKPVLTETGFEWISRRAAAGSILLVALLAAAGWLLLARSGWRPMAGFLLAAVIAVSAVNLALAAVTQRAVNSDTLTCAATVVPAGEAVTLLVANVPAWQAMLSGWGIVAGIAGAALLGIGALRARRGKARAGWLVPAGAVLLAAGVLAQRGGAAVFFQMIAVGVFLGLMLPMLVHWFRRPKVIAEPLAALWIAAACLALAPGARAQEEKAAESVSQTWTIEKGRLRGEIEMQVRGAAGDNFLLLRPPAVLSDFSGDGLRVAKVDRGGQPCYFAVLEREGTFTARAKFEMAAGNPAGGILLPTGRAAAQRVSVTLDQGGWELFSDAAASVQPVRGLPADKTGATLVLLPADAPRIGVRALSRDVAAEKPQYFAEVSNLFVPGPGVVNGYCRATIRPVQGRVSELELDVPKGFTVGDVANGPVGEWRFDPRARKLHVSVAPAQEGGFKFDVEMQLGTSGLPVDVALEPVRVGGAAGEVGMIGLAFGGDAQPEDVRGPSAVNLEDFDAQLVPKSPDGRPLATLQQVFRYGQEGARVTLRVAPVAPEVRAVTRQVFSFGDDRLLAAVDLRVLITRAGLFQLALDVPEALEVEAITGPSLSSWSESRSAGRRIISLQLSGRTIGEQNFTMSFTGAAPPAGENWLVPRVSLAGAARQTGEIFLVPEKGIRLRAMARENVSYLDPREEGAAQPGALAFRLLQQDWSLKLGIEALDPWVTAQALQDVTLREGQTLTRIGVRYRIENAAVKQLRVRLPSLTPAQIRTIRANGAAVSDFTRVAGEGDLWEIRFQRGIVGETCVQIEYQGESAREQGRELVRIPVFEGARQVAQFVAVRSSGRLDVNAGTAPRGWQPVDWSAVPADLQDRADRSVPALCFRVAEPEAPLAVNIQRHGVADALKLRVRRGELSTLFSAAGPSITAAQLTVEVVEKSSMRMRLPKGAELMSAFVNAESVPVVREGDTYLFNVSPNSDSDRTAGVRVVYSVPLAQRGDVELQGPSLDVPLEDVSWRMILPPGRELAGCKGGMRLMGASSGGEFDLKDYVSLSSATLDREAKKATALIEQANSLLERGDQIEAGEVLSRAANANTGDEAFNEDARVQLRSLKTQQAVVGLNTRRQRLYLDNRSNGLAVQNAQLEQAAGQNAVMQGSTNFDIQQVDRLLMGNSVDENTALRGIAARIVEQQLSAEPPPGAIDVTLPEDGRSVTFARSIQVDGDAPLSMRLSLAAAGGANGWTVCALLLAVALAGSLISRRGRTQERFPY